MFVKMKKYILFLLSLSILGFSSCSDVLDGRDTSVISPDIWNSEQSASLWINTLYSQTPITTSITTSTSPFGDHASFCDETTGANEFINGEYTYNSVGVFNDTYYNKIRNINLALKNMQTSTLEGKARGRIVGQAYFLRAWAYWNLVVVYGGVPYVTEPVNPFVDSSEALDPPRNKTSECIQYICDDLDLAIQNLPVSTTEYLSGSTEYARITRAAAAALKGRILLFYASPQFNPNNDALRWEKAYQANKEAQSIADADGYGLMNTAGSDPLNGSFANLYIKEGTENKEALFVKAYDLSVTRTHGWENSVRPYVAGVDGGQSCNPTWDLVKAFPMKNGLLVKDASSGFDSTYYWLNRDPRFYASIGYNGCNWPLTGMEGTQVWSYAQSNTEKINGTKTGFYCRKMTNASITKTSTKECGTDWIEIRYAEILMNLAECANETGLQSEAITLLTQIRQRAGIDSGDGFYGLQSSYSNKTDLTEIIMNERRVEFAFENKRMWDLRRRDMYNQNLGNTPKLNGSQRWILATNVIYPSGVITPPQKAAYEAELQAMRGTINMDTESANYFTNRFSASVADINYPIAVPEIYSFFAIPQNILNRSQAIKQTKGWGDGQNEFDPYE